MKSPTAQSTDFSRDALGRYICNGFDEAIQSAQGAGSRPFDIIIVGGGSFASGRLALTDLYLRRRGGWPWRVERSAALLAWFPPSPDFWQERRPEPGPG